MSERRIALLELIENIERLGRFQDRLDFPSSVNQIWSAFLVDVQNLIEIEVCALFLVDENTNEFILKYAVPEDSVLCRRIVPNFAEKKLTFKLNAAFFHGSSTADNRR